MPLSENAEGTLSWIDIDRLAELPLWEGDRHFLPLVFDEAVKQFHGVMPYADGKPVSWSYQLALTAGWMFSTSRSHS